MKVDLVSPVATPAVALLDAQIADAFARLGRLAGDMTQSELEYAGPRGDRNTTASLLAHLAHVDMTWLAHLQGREAPAGLGPARDAGGRIPAVKGETAQALPARYARVQDQIHAHTAALGDGDLAQALPAWHGYEVTPRWALQCITHGLRRPWLRTSTPSCTRGTSAG